ncbi:MAG TPA: ABC transporter ATP-binding protein [Pirellulales bacterium]|nr:ABC transporter ATP-binding protein [Pirellulales bacterium]
MLRLQNVKKSFREPEGDILPILDIERFEVAAGEQAVLVGRSGCGKSTLLHIISGITRADQGTIEIDGLDIGRLPETARDRFRADKLGYIFQTFNLLPGFSALENVLLGMAFATGKPDVARGKHLLERVGLGHRMTHKPSMLSVGEQQRVAVARALANRPKLLLADEPTANVDTRHQQQIIDLIRETCHEENVALVLVTHTPEVAQQFPRVDNLEDFNRALTNGVASGDAARSPSARG